MTRSAPHDGADLEVVGVEDEAPSLPPRVLTRSQKRRRVVALVVALVVVAAIVAWPAARRGLTAKVFDRIDRTWRQRTNAFAHDNALLSQLESGDFASDPVALADASRLLRQMAARDRRPVPKLGRLSKRADALLVDVNQGIHIALRARATATDETAHRVADAALVFPVDLTGEPATAVAAADTLINEGRRHWHRPERRPIQQPFGTVTDSAIDRLHTYADDVTGLRLLAWSGNPGVLSDINVDKSQTTVVASGQGTHGLPSPGAIVVRKSYVAFLANGLVHLIADADGSITESTVGASVNVLVPAVDPDRVWVSDGSQVWELDGRGSPVRPPVPLPSNTLLGNGLSAAPAGVVLADDLGSTVGVWDPISRHFRPVDGDIVAVHGNMAAITPHTAFVGTGLAQGGQVADLSLIKPPARRTLDLVDLASGAKQATITTDGDVAFAEFSPDGTRLALAINDGADVSVLRLPDPHALPVLLPANGQSARALTWTPNGRHLVLTFGRHDGLALLAYASADGFAATSLRVPPGLFGVVARAP